MEQDTFEWVEGLVNDALASNRISDWERGFLGDQRERLEKYGQDTRFSAKQWGILDRVAGKLGYPARDATEGEV